MDNAAVSRAIITALATDEIDESLDRARSEQRALVAELQKIPSGTPDTPATKRLWRRYEFVQAQIRELMAMQEP